MHAHNHATKIRHPRVGSALTEGEGDEEGGEGQAELEHVRSPDGQPHKLVVF